MPPLPFCLRTPSLCLLLALLILNCTLEITYLPITVYNWLLLKLPGRSTPKKLLLTILYLLGLYKLRTWASTFLIGGPFEDPSLTNYLTDPRWIRREP